MSDSYKDVESRVTKTLKTIHNDLTSNILCYSCDFHVPYYCLYCCHQNRNSHSTWSPTNWKLTEVQEEAVIDHMTQMNDLFMSLILSLIWVTANLVLHIDHNGPSETAPRVGPNWVTWFKKWHSEFYECISCSLEIDRNTVQDVNALKVWFEVFNQIMMNNEILSSDLWNFDETEFNIDMTENTIVLTKHPFRRQNTSSSENQIWISLIETINVIEDFLSVFHILSEKCLLANWFSDCHSDDCLAVSDTGYSNEILDLEYLKKFDEYSMWF